MGVESHSEMNSNCTQGEHFAMFLQDEAKKLWPMVRDRTLKPMDLCVVSYLCSHMDIRTGRIERRTKDIADDLGVTQPHLTMSMKRLRSEHLLAKGLKGTGYYWMLNPYFWSVGRREIQGKRIVAFQSLIND